MQSRTDPGSLRGPKATPLMGAHHRATILRPLNCHPAHGRSSPRDHLAAIELPPHSKLRTGGVEWLPTRALNILKYPGSML